MQVPVVDLGLQRPRCGGRATGPSHRCLPACTSPAGLAQPCLIPQRRVAAARRGLVISAAAGIPPPVSDTKAKFYEQYRKPMNAIYNTVIQELLVQQHIIRYNTKYHYDAVYALGFVSIFDQILEGVPADKEAIFAAYISALTEDPKQYREDAAKLEQWASGISNPADLHPSVDGDDDVRKALAQTAERIKNNEFLYSRFFAVGLFRLLELCKAKDPSALQGLVASMNVNKEAVDRDLMNYKSTLSKLNAAKEMLQEYTARERKKAEERAAAKAEAAKPKEESKEDKAKDESEKEPAKV